MSGSSDPVSVVLTAGAEKIISIALEQQQKAGHAELGTNHWLIALLDHRGPMAEALVPKLDAHAAASSIRERLDAGDIGTPLDRDEMLRRVAEVVGGGTNKASERALARAVLAAAGYEVAPAEDPSDKREAEPGLGRPTPTLDQYGRDLTQDAAEGKLVPIVGRDREIQACLEILCRSKKRNPALIGAAGVGKTAIVEGLAQRFVAGDVPPMLKGARIVALQPSSLVAGAGVMGELEKRWQAILAEARQPGIILFIDEVHTIVGSGGMVGTTDVGALLKPTLARGDLAVIGATTDDEYRQFIERDRALERRFQPIAVQEMTAQDTLPVVRSHRDKLVELRGIRMSDEALSWLVEFGADFMRNRHFPDKAIDLLEQCVSYAVVQQLEEVDVATAQTVAQRMVGMPIDLGERLETLETRLAEGGLLPADEADALIGRLHVTMRGLDLRPQRPSAVVLLVDEAAGLAEDLGGLLAEALFGAEERVISIDFGAFDDDSDVNALLGAPPGYIGFKEALPLHQVAAAPWSVLVCKNVNGCHPQVLEVLTHALEDGYVTQRDGKHIFLSDTVLIATAPSEIQGRHPIGFVIREDDRRKTGNLRDAVEDELGEDLTRQLDVICATVPTQATEQRRWLERQVLEELGEHYLARGLDLNWDASFLEWAADRQGDRRSVTRLIEERLGQLLIPQLPAPGTKVSVTIAVHGEEINVLPEGGREATDLPPKP